MKSAVTYSDKLHHERTNSQVAKISWTNWSKKRSWCGKMEWMKTLPLSFPVKYNQWKKIEKRSFWLKFVLQNISYFCFEPMCHRILFNMYILRMVDIFFMQCVTHPPPCGSVRPKPPFWFRLRYRNRNWKLAETLGRYRN